MRQISAWTWSASAVALIPILATAGVGPGSPAQKGAPNATSRVWEPKVARGDPPTRVRPDKLGAGPPVWSLEPGNPAPVQLVPVAYGPPNPGATPEIISRVGEILGVMDNPERRNQLAERWLQYSKQVIAKEQEFRDQWLRVQRQQLAQQEQATQLQREIAQFQMRIEELHAQNLRLEQENLQARQQLAQGAHPQAPRASLPTPAPR